MIFRLLHFQRCLLHGLRGALFTLCALVSVTVISAEAGYTFTPVADSTGVFSSFAFFSPSLNAGGTVAFFAQLDSGSSGVFAGNGGNVTTIGINALPFGGATSPTINQAGTVAFYASDWNGVGKRILAGNGGPLVTIADTAGQFKGFASGYSTAINATGTVAFWAALDIGPGGIFLNSGGTVTPVLVNSPSLGANSSISLNDAGTVAFRANFQTGTITGVATISSGLVTTIADSTGQLNYFGSAPSLNSAGTVAFSAGTGGNNGGVFGIYSGNGGPLTTIADLSGPFSYLGDFNSYQPSINAPGVVAFAAGLDAGGGGIFIGDGTTTSAVVSAGDALFGSVVTGASISPTSLNDLGQVAFYYRLANGTTGIAIANPVPEPSASLLLALSFGLSLARRTARKG